MPANHTPPTRPLRDEPTRPFGVCAYSQLTHRRKVDCLNFVEQGIAGDVTTEPLCNCCTPPSLLRMHVHTHGSEEGPGLACAERRVDGRLVGGCVLAASAGERAPDGETPKRLNDGAMARVFGSLSHLANPASLDDAPAPLDGERATTAFVHTTPIPDADAARLLTESPARITTGWEAMLVRHIASLESRLSTTTASLTAEREARAHDAELIASLPRDEQGFARTQDEWDTLAAYAREQAEARERAEQERAALEACVQEAEAKLFAANTTLRYGTPFDPTGAKNGTEITSLRASLALAEQEREQLASIADAAADYHDEHHAPAIIGGIGYQEKVAAQHRRQTRLLALLADRAARIARAALRPDGEGTT